VEEVADRRDPLTREDLRRRRALRPQPDPSPGDLAIDRAHGAVEGQAPLSGFGRPEVFHVIGSTTRSVMFRRLDLLIVGWPLLATARGSSNGPTTAAIPADPQLIPEFTADYE